MIVKKRFLVEIAVDDQTVQEKYPNYRFNFDKPVELISHIAANIKWEGETNMTTDGMKQWGYSITVKPVSEKTI